MRVDGGAHVRHGADGQWTMQFVVRQMAAGDR